MMFQYRKRYELHAIRHYHIGHKIVTSFNTASGMNCMQSRVVANKKKKVVFQYRKRYELHAIAEKARSQGASACFNTASGMNCMQFFCIGFIKMIFVVSIPQAV